MLGYFELYWTGKWDINSIKSRRETDLSSMRTIFSDGKTMQIPLKRNYFQGVFTETHEIMVHF